MRRRRQDEVEIRPREVVPLAEQRFAELPRQGVAETDYVNGSSTNRNIAIYGNHIIDTGADNYLYALDAETGRLAWETQIVWYYQHLNGRPESTDVLRRAGIHINY